ncbi:polysaccharide deacetylase family protein [Cupriavidus basilensis]|uniref:Polysaccharide deacetylase family protein n=1 Tax=Cupriavidus basilensis TaxID=68895 RepID=A0ABT6AZ72_9BURK|nr:polysaccharide deacetylase family protein [Cupriavidus basilensis]MDF3837919.1 polysaccharide deacetylase family protein [Cupriavidus basilensis]
MTQPIPILMYHQIDAPPPRGTPLRSLVVAPRDFGWQMRMLKLMGFRGLGLTELLPYLRGAKAGKVVGITFDDGYRNNIEHALPALQRVGFSATCYAVSGLIGKTNAWDAAIGVPAKPLMTRAELREWRRAGMEIGAHTRTHLDLAAAGARAARDEIEGCRHELEDAIGEPVRHFCYPFGEYDRAVVALVREAGFHSAVTTNRGRACAAHDFFHLPRVPVSRATHPLQFLQKLLTSYEDRRGTEVARHDGQ